MVMAKTGVFFTVLGLIAIFSVIIYVYFTASQVATEALWGYVDPSKEEFELCVKQHHVTIQETLPCSPVHTIPVDGAGEFCTKIQIHNASDVYFVKTETYTTYYVFTQDKRTTYYYRFT